MKVLTTVLWATIAMLTQGVTLEGWQATVGKRFRVEVVERPAIQPKRLMSVACPTSGTVSFKSVEKPSAASGFFSIGAHANEP